MVQSIESFGYVHVHSYRIFSLLSGLHETRIDYDETVFFLVKTIDN